jgi:nucleoid-associated protein YgaU
MSKPPTVIRSWAQGSPAERAFRKQNQAKAAAAIREAPLPPRIATTSQEVGFTGIKGATVKRFSALAGEGNATITGGWAKIAEVPRFQRVAITVPEGYPPLQITIPILFDAVVKTKNRESVEAEILILEWMAGRPATSAEIKGEPPLVEVYSVNANGAQTNLVPKPLQTVPGRNQSWYITNLAFGESVPNELIRSSGGDRIRQAVTVTLTEVVSAPSLIQRRREEREAVKGKFQTFRTTQAIDSIKKVASAGYGKPGIWKAILAANRKLGSNPERELKPGTKVKVPEDALLQVAK